MSASLLREPQKRAQAKLLSFPAPVVQPAPASIAQPAPAPLPEPAAYAAPAVEREPRHSALLLAAVVLIALLLYFSAALV